MKKILLFTAVLSAFSFASCKKDHACTCTDASTATTVETFDVTGNSVTSSSSDSNADAYVITGAKKKDAKKACINSTSTDTYSYDSYDNNPTTGSYESTTNVVTTKTESTCSLK